MKWASMLPILLLLALASTARAESERRANGAKPLKNGGKAPADDTMKIASWTPQELDDFVAAVRPTGVDPSFALEVYNYESRLQPHAVNPGSKAQGLAQMMPATVKGVGYTGDPLQFHLLTLQEQFPFIAELLRQQVAMLHGRAPESAVKLWHVHLFPYTAQDTVVFSRAKYPKEYAGNAQLDADGKGYIDEGDLRKALDRAKTPALTAMLEQISTRGASAFA